MTDHDRTAGAATPVQRSDAEWRESLTPEQYYVRRQKGTEADSREGER